MFSEEIRYAAEKESRRAKSGKSGMNGKKKEIIIIKDKKKQRKAEIEKTEGDG